MPNKDKITTLILPGLDGSNSLLSEFASLAPPRYQVRVLSLPDISPVNYKDLVEHFSKLVQESERCIIIAESFSGPLGILLAERHPEIITHLVLAATFASPPAPSIIRWLPWSLIFSFPIPRIVARLLIGRHRSLLLPLRKSLASQSGKAKANRIRMISRINVLSELAELNCPILYLAPDSDRLLGEQYAREIANKNDLVTIRKIPGPHLLLQAEPSLCWEEIKRFVD